MDIGEERKEITVVPVELPATPTPVLDPEPAGEPVPAPAEPVKEPVGV